MFWDQVTKRTEGRETSPLTPYQYHKLWGQGGKILTLFEQLELGVSLVPLICLGVPLLRAVKSLASEKAYPAKGLSACRLQSCTLPVGKGRAPPAPAVQGKGPAECLSWLGAGRDRRCPLTLETVSVLLRYRTSQKEPQWLPTSSPTAKWTLCPLFEDRGQRPSHCHSHFLQGQL